MTVILLFEWVSDSGPRRAAVKVTRGEAWGVPSSFREVLPRYSDDSRTSTDLPRDAEYAPWE